MKRCQKLYFPSSAQNPYANLRDMTYEQVLRRFVQLCTYPADASECKTERSPGARGDWIDAGFGMRFRKIAQRFWQEETWSVASR